MSGMEHGFIVYPFKYDHETHQKTVGSFASPEEEAENWHFFKQELLELGRKYRQWAVYFVEPKTLQPNERMRHSDLQSSDIYDEAGVRVARFGALNNQYYGARAPYKKKDVPFTNLRGRTGRTKATKASPNGLSAVDRQRLTDHSFVAFENPPKSRPKPRGWKRP